MFWKFELLKHLTKQSGHTKLTVKTHTRVYVQKNGYWKARNRHGSNHIITRHLHRDVTCEVRFQLGMGFGEDWGGWGGLASKKFSSHKYLFSMLHYFQRLQAITSLQCKFLIITLKKLSWFDKVNLSERGKVVREGQWKWLGTVQFKGYWVDGNDLVQSSSRGIGVNWSSFNVVG